MMLGSQPSLHEASNIALASGALAVSAPLGADPLLGELAMARYSFAAMELLDDVTISQTDEADLEASASQAL